MVNTLGSRQKTFIAHMGMNQQQFAEALKCSPGFLSEIIRDIKNELHVETLRPKKC